MRAKIRERKPVTNYNMKRTGHKEVGIDYGRFIRILVIYLSLYRELVKI
jgi:hypothetical protein